MCGRAGEFNVLAELEGAQPLVGQIILEIGVPGLKLYVPRGGVE